MWEDRGTAAYAQKSNISSESAVTLTYEGLNGYIGLDLTAAQFDENSMNDKQKELYIFLLEKEYEKQMSSLKEQGIDKKRVH